MLKRNNSLIIESEEEADDAFFCQLDSDIEQYGVSLNAKALQEDLISTSEWEKENFIIRTRIEDGIYSSVRMGRLVISEDDKGNTIVKFRCKNCTTIELIEWFTETSDSRYFQIMGDYLSINTENLHHLTYFTSKLENIYIDHGDGTQYLLVITFEDYINCWSLNQKKSLKKEIDILAKQAKIRLGVD